MESFRTNIVRLLAAFLIAGLAGVLPARAGLVAFDSFDDYPEGNIDGLDGGMEWGGAWEVRNIAGGDPGVSTVSSAAIVYEHGGMLLGGGKSLRLSHVSNGTRRKVFPAIKTDGADYYVSFIFRFSGTVFAGWQALDANPNIGNDSIALVNTNGAVGARVGDETTSSSAGFVPPDTTCLMVIQFTGWTGAHYSTLNLWINPIPGPQSANTISASHTNAAPGVGSAGFLGVYIRTIIDSYESLLIDDLKVGTDWTSVTSAPEKSRE
jgi:hypothetical protein